MIVHAACSTKYLKMSCFFDLFYNKNNENLFKLHKVLAEKNQLKTSSEVLATNNQEILATNNQEETSGLINEKIMKEDSVAEGIIVSSQVK